MTGISSRMTSKRKESSVGKEQSRKTSRARQMTSLSLRQGMRRILGSPILLEPSEANYSRLESWIGIFGRDRFSLDFALIVPFRGRIIFSLEVPVNQTDCLTALFGSHNAAAHGVQ